MAEDSFKKRVQKELIKASKEYKDVYVDYVYLICSEAFVQKDYYIVDAKEDNFQHLTGVHTSMNAKKFFDKCIQGTLTEYDFDFVKKGQDEKSVKGTVRRKIKFAVLLPQQTIAVHWVFLDRKNQDRNP